MERPESGDHQGRALRPFSRAEEAGDEGVPTQGGAARRRVHRGASQRGLGEGESVLRTSGGTHDGGCLQSTGQDHGAAAVAQVILKSLPCFVCFFSGNFGL